MADSLGDRMKGYEAAARTLLPRRLPVIIRVDGRAFHTYAADCKKPFDERLIYAMDLTALELCRNIGGAELAFIQSDEISVLLHGYKRLESQPWFDNKVQKIVSVAASTAAARMTVESVNVFGVTKMATFDARAFVLPEAEVCNYFIWRQQDWTRNSIQMLARSMYSHSDCHGKSQSELQEMCFSRGQNWNNLGDHLKRGRCVIYQNGKWIVDNRIPIFQQDRSYIERHLACEQ